MLYHRVPEKIPLVTPEFNSGIPFTGYRMSPDGLPWVCLLEYLSTFVGQFADTSNVGIWHILSIHRPLILTHTTFLSFLTSIWTISSGVQVMSCGSGCPIIVHYLKKKEGETSLRRRFLLVAGRFIYQFCRSLYLVKNSGYHGINHRP